MDNDETHVAGDFFLHSWTPDGTNRRKTLREHFHRFVPPQTMIHIQYCLLRIPFLLMYDFLFTDKFAASMENAFQHSVEIIERGNYQSWTQPLTSVLHILMHLCLLVSLPILALTVAILFLLCSDRRLVIFYSYTISLLVIYFDYQMTNITDTPTSSSINLYILQFLLSTIYIQMLNIRPRVRSSKIQTRLCHLAPFVLLITHYLIPAEYSLYLLKLYYLLWTCVHLSEVIICHRQTVLDLIRFRLLRELYQLYANFGLQTVFNYLQTHIHISTLLKIFWLTKIIVSPLGFRTVYTSPYVANVTMNSESTINLTLQEKPEIYNETVVKTIYFTSLFYGTETIFTLISLAFLVSHVMKSVSHRLFRLLHLWTEDVEQIGTVVGVMFFLLLFQSNITRLDLNRRHVPLLKAFSLLIVALFHFLHTILEPQLLKVAIQTMTSKMAFDQTTDNIDQETTGDDKNNQKSVSSTSFSLLHSYHHRHVYTCLSVLCLIILYITILWNVTNFSTWLLAVTAFSLELIVRLLASLAQFTVYVLDGHNRLPNAESFDEYIFRIKAVTSCVEFILGVFLLCNGFYILCFESRGALRAVMLAVHAYLNIIKNLRRGWQIFRNRKSAWNNVNQLPLATNEQINEYNDICPICHNALTSGVACVTPCAHIFHQICLQKAFYVTQNCALCSRPIIVEGNEH